MLSRLNGFRSMAGSVLAASTSNSFPHKIFSIESKGFNECLTAAVECLRGHGVIAIPTDTIYGITSRLALIDRLFEIKGRARTKPVAICVHEIMEIFRFCKVTVPISVLQALLPGAVTVVFERSADLPSNVNPGVSLLGVRIPDHEFVRKLCESLGEPLALTSANVSDGMSSLCVEDFAELHDKIDMIIDGGSIEGSRFGSTVVDLSLTGKFHIIREGSALQQTLKTLKSFNLEPITSQYASC